MAAVKFAKAREAFLGGDIDLAVATIKIALVRGYTYNSAHDFVDDVTGAGGTLVATATLSGKSITDGVFDASDGTFGTVAGGAACDMLLFYQSSAVGGGADVASSAQRLIAYDTGATNLPVTPDGGEITFAFDNGANKIFKV